MQSETLTPKRKSRTTYKTIKIKVPKHYVFGSPDKDGNHEFLTRNWYRSVTRTDEFWVDFLDKVPKGVLTARFPVTINTTLVADTARTLKERLERQATLGDATPTAGALADNPAAYTSTRHQDVNPQCSICGTHIDEGHEKCWVCIAAADDNDDLGQTEIKRRAPEPQEDTTVVVQVPTLKRESSPVVKREEFESKKLIPMSVDREEHRDADLSYLSSRRIGAGRRSKRAKLDVTHKKDEVVARAGDDS